MSIASLSTIATSHFSGNAHITGAGAADLAGLTNTIIAKVNEVISGLTDGSLDALLIGDGTQGSYYGGSSDSYFEVDGTNPPRVNKLQLLDQTDGTWHTVTVNNGVLELDESPV